MATKIMVVDDEPAIGKLLLYQLSGFGYQVSYIQDGLSALQHLTAERPDLVLLDVMMPQISGWEICRQIRAYSTVPVIMLTAKSADPDIVTGLEAGADEPAETATARPFRLGQYIHNTRLSQGLALHQVERACKIRWEFLQAIEHENWDYVPRDELRRALRGYTNYLGIDLERLIGRPQKTRTLMQFPFPFAAALTLVMVLLVVGMYLF